MMRDDGGKDVGAVLSCEVGQVAFESVNRVQREEEEVEEGEGEESEANRDYIQYRGGFGGAIIWHR